MVTRLQLGEIMVEVVQKDIKNVHLSVYPPHGRVKISAPLRMSADTIRVFAISKIGWIKQQQAKLRSQEREPPREYLDRESHYVWGKRYLLKLVESNSPPAIALKPRWMVMSVRPGTDDTKKRAILEDWYREQIRQAIPPLLARWEPVLGVKVNRFFVQRMKTKWGSCSPESHGIRLNTELARKPPECLEYIAVHEMAHLIVRRHNDRFVNLLDACLPNWKQVRQLLNGTPLSHADWTY
jgi:predicted metal-dependent hydrolase